jgi:hypothetical protein
MFLRNVGLPSKCMALKLRIPYPPCCLYLLLIISFYSIALNDKTVSLTMNMRWCVPFWSIITAFVRSTCRISRKSSAPYHISGPRFENKISRMRGRNADYLAVMFSEKQCCNIFSGLISSEQNSYSLFPVAPTLEHGASVELFVSLQFLNPITVDSAPWMGHELVSMPLPTQTQKNTDKHPCLKWDSNPRSQLSSGWRQFMP